ELISELELENSVKLLGYRTDLEWYVNACNLVVSSSFREGLPVNVLEAMFCKKVVVASNNRGHRELISDGKNGYLVEPGDEKAFAEKITMLIMDKDKYKHIGLDGKKTMQEYTDTNVLYELATLYDIRIK
ncbi:MAG TPA: glycosyltransferase family 1 protein, partial [Terrisporobacter glycolicus]